MSNDLTVYWYPKCGTCRSAAKWLEAKGYTLQTSDLFQQAPSASELTELIRISGLPLKKFFNVSGEVYKEMGLKDKLGGMSDEEQIALLASNGRLVKRPIVTDGAKITVGFKEDEYSQVWGAGR